jgi:hypothetical protein
MWSKIRYLQRNKCGFRSKSSTDKASFTLIHEILTAFNNKQIVGGIFCDLRKAFDCVNHKIDSISKGGVLCWNKDI